MAIKFQYNKTSLGDLGKQLKMRQKALPTIKSKESALRSEVKKAKDSAGDYRRRLDRLKAEYDYMVSLWGEFDCDLLRIADVELSVQKIAGVRTPVLQDVKFEVKPYDLFSSPVWFADGVDILKRMAQLGIEFEVYNRKMELLDNQPEESLCRSTVALMAKHAAHFKKVGGIEIIGLGSDFDGIGGELEMDDCSKLPLLAEALRREGFTEDEVERIFYRNAQRFFEDNL